MFFLGLDIYYTITVYVPNIPTKYKLAHEKSLIFMLIVKKRS